jgi:hypothetical protein
MAPSKMHTWLHMVWEAYVLNCTVVALGCMRWGAHAVFMRLKCDPPHPILCSSNGYNSYNSHTNVCASKLPALTPDLCFTDSGMTCKEGKDKHFAGGNNI